MHMGLQMLVWGVSFPVGMVFGITKSRWHVPLQVTNTGELFRCDDCIHVRRGLKGGGRGKGGET